MQSKLKNAAGNERSSGIELLKIFAILLIVISHVVQTLRSAKPEIPYDAYLLDLTAATTDIRIFALTLFSYFGAWGNTIFFVCSAWFLLRSSECKKQKWFSMFFEIWVVSIVILVVTLVARKGNISVKNIVRSLMPTTFSNNWYLTCYLLFYPIHPYLNSIIHKMDKKHLFRMAAVLFTLYCCLNFIKGDLFFPSSLILWISIYFVIAYIQLYLCDFSESLKSNVIMLCTGLGSYIGIAVVTNIIGLRWVSFQNSMLIWATNCNPFIIMSSIALFNLMRKLAFTNKVINYISGLSLVIYIIHENLILRTYYRPALWNYIYVKYGYDNIVSWTLLLSLIILIFGAASSILYDKTLRPLIKRGGNKIYLLVRKVLLFFENQMLKIH